MNEKVRSRAQATEMGFLRRISGLTLLDKVKNVDVRKSLNIKSLHFRLERSQLWSGACKRKGWTSFAFDSLRGFAFGTRKWGGGGTVS